MPDHKTKFNRSWLDKKDENGSSIKSWLKQGSCDSTFVCMLCNTKELDCSNKGWKAVEQHMQKEKHRQKINSLKNNTRFCLPSVTTSSSSSTSNTIQLVGANRSLCFDDQITKAETLWAMKSAQQGFSYKSSDEIGDLFRTMFPDSKIAEKFSMQHSKLSYVISHGIGPYFRTQVIDEVKPCQKFVLCFDEQTNNQNNKQLDLLLRYWHTDREVVVTRYYRTVLLGHAQAKVVTDNIIDAFRTDGIDISKLLMLSRDNPNVNKSIEKIIGDEMRKLGGELMVLGACNLHVVHNGFKAGTNSLSQNDHLTIKLLAFYRNTCYKLAG